VAAFVLAVLHPWNHAHVGSEQFGDAAYWDLAGESWARGYVATKAPDIRSGYSEFLGIVYSLSSASWSHAFVAQALLYASGVGVRYAMGRQLGGRLLGLLAALLLTLDPYMWEWTATSTIELLGSIASLASVFFLLKALRPRRASPGRRYLAFASHLRTLSGRLVCYISWWRLRWLFYSCVRPLHERVKLGAVAIVASAITLLPSVLYQYASTGDPGLSSNGAANLYAASSSLYKTWVPASMTTSPRSSRQVG
jgi:hypothetical protein